MNKTVRIGTIEDQDHFRRDDVLRMTPDDRVRLVFEMQSSILGAGRQPLARVATVRRLGGKPRAPSRAIEGPA